MMAGRYSHAKQFKRHTRELKFLRTRLGRLIRDITRKIGDDEGLLTIFTMPLLKARQIRSQKQRQRGWKLYSWHAPETECIGKGKAHKPYEFGCKVSITTTNRRCKGGQFVLHAKAFHGNPYDGHTLNQVVEETEALTGREIERVYVDKGYRGHDVENPRRVFLSGQKRGVHGQIKQELRRRSAIGDRGRDRPHQDGWPPGSKLPERTRRRSRKCRAQRHRLQPAPHPPMVQDAFAYNYRNHLRRSHVQIITQNGFLTGD